jgi:nuclear pore complex protein Nup155
MTTSLNNLNRSRRRSPDDDIYSSSLNTSSYTIHNTNQYPNLGPNSANLNSSFANVNNRSFANNPNILSSNQLIVHPKQLAESKLADDDNNSSAPLQSQQIDVKSLLNAAQLIESSLDSDEKGVKPFESLNSSDNGTYTYVSSSQPAAGISQLTSSAISAGPINTNNSSTLTLKRITAIPSSILDEYNSVEMRSICGLLNEINRAYITIDNKLFLWNYFDGSDFYVYDELTQIITSVALVRPKPGVFAANIPFLLVVTTPVEILLFAISFENNSIYGSLQLFPTQFSCPSDDIIMLRCVGTDLGRIFLCGRDGLVYELQYELKQGWFSKKCRKVKYSQSAFDSLRFLLPTFLFGSAEDPIRDLVIDSSRNPNLLFTLTAKNNISVYSLGRDGTALNFITSNNQTFEESQQQLNHVNRQYTDDWINRTEFQLISLAVIPRTESERVNLLAISNHGHRLYFTLQNWPQNSNFVLSQPHLQLQHIRLSPPGLQEPELTTQRSLAAKQFEPAFKRGRSAQLVHRAFYRDGVALLADCTRAQQFQGNVSNNTSGLGANNSINDSLLNIVREPSSSATKLFEAVNCIDLPTKIADIQELHSSFYLNELSSCLYARGSEEPLQGLTELATQHVTPPRQFLVLAYNALYQYNKPRPIDELREILQRKRKSNEEFELNLFLQKYSLKETLAMCLILITAAPALQALTHTSIESKQNGHNLSVSSPNRYDSTQHFIDSDGSLAKSARSVFFRYGSELLNLTSLNANNSSSYSIANQSLGNVANIVRPSTGKIDSLALYVSRLLRPLWDWTIVVHDPNNLRDLRLRYSRTNLIELQNPLVRLKDFIEENLALFVNPNLNQRSGSSNANLNDLLRLDRESFDSLRLLLDLSIQSVFLLIILSEQDFNFIQILNNLRDSEVDFLREAKFYDLLTAAEGQAVFKSLISAIISTINSNINAVTNNFSNSSSEYNSYVSKLHENCPTFFGEADLLYYKAAELLNQLKLKQSTAPNQSNRRERENLLQEALNYYKFAAKSNQFPLEEIVKRLAEVGAFPAIAELCLFRAELLIRREIAPPKLLSTGNNAAFSGSTALISPNAELEFIEQEKKRSYDRIFDSLSYLLQPNSASSMNGEQQTALSPVDRANFRDQMVALCLQSEDIDLHENLYQFYIENNLKEELFKLKSSYLIKFLTSDDKYVNLLRDYYLRQNLYKPAALLLHQLAFKKSKEYNLNDRLGFLARALTCARKATEQNQTQNSRNNTNFINISSNNMLISSGGVQYDNSEDENLIFQLRERIEIGKIQQKIYSKLRGTLDDINIQLQSSSELQNSGNSNLSIDDQQVSALYDKVKALEDSLEGLDEELLDIESLYFLSQRFALWFECLLVVNFSNERNREDVVEALYKNIFRSEISAAKQRRLDWTVEVGNKLAELAALYNNNDFMFPLQFIIQELEYNNNKYRSQPDANWVSAALIQAKLNLNKVLLAYERIIERKIDDPQLEFFIYTSITNILQHLVNTQPNFSAQTRITRSNRNISQQTAATNNISTVAALNLCTKAVSNLRSVGGNRNYPTDQLLQQLNKIQQSITQL